MNNCTMGKELKIKAFQSVLLNLVFPAKYGHCDGKEEPILTFPTGLYRVWPTMRAMPFNVCRVSRTSGHPWDWEDFDLNTCSEQELDTLLLSLDPNFDLELWHLKKELV